MTQHKEILWGIYALMIVASYCAIIIATKKGEISRFSHFFLSFFWPLIVLILTITFFVDRADKKEERKATLRRENAYKNP